MYCIEGSARKKSLHIIHLFIFKENLQHSRCSVSTGEFYTSLLRSNDEKLIEIHSTLCNLVFPTSHFLIFSQKEDEDKKRKDEENQRNAKEHGSNGGGGGGGGEKAQVRATSNFHDHCGLNLLTAGPRRSLW